MSHNWMNTVGPVDYQPDYNDYIAECESVDDLLANVGSYDDWFPDLERK